MSVAPTTEDEYGRHREGDRHCRTRKINTEFSPSHILSLAEPLSLTVMPDFPLAPHTEQTLAATKISIYVMWLSCALKTPFVKTRPTRAQLPFASELYSSFFLSPVLSLQTNTQKSKLLIRCPRRC